MRRACSKRCAGALHVLLPLACIRPIRNVTLLVIKNTTRPLSLNLSCQKTPSDSHFSMRVRHRWSILTIESDLLGVDLISALDYVALPVGIRPRSTACGCSDVLPIILFALLRCTYIIAFRSTSSVQFPFGVPSGSRSARSSLR